MLTNTAINDSIVVNMETGISASIGARDFCGIAVLSQAGNSLYGAGFKSILLATNSVSPGGQPLRLQYQWSTDKFQVRVQDSTAPLEVAVLTADTLGHTANDSILLAAWSWDDSAKALDVWARTLGGTKRIGGGTGSASFSGVPEPTGLIVGRYGSPQAYIGSTAIALGTGVLTSGNFDDIYTAFSTSPTWGALKEFATLASAVTWHIGFPITTGSGT